MLGIVKKYNKSKVMFKNRLQVIFILAIVVVICMTIQFVIMLNDRMIILEKSIDIIEVLKSFNEPMYQEIKFDLTNTILGNQS